MTPLIAALCLLATASAPESQVAARFATCVAVAAAAEEAALDPVIVASVARTESNFRGDLVGTRGEIGPLQAMPQYYCPGGKAKGCDPLGVGLTAIRAERLRYGVRPKDWLCHHNSGNVCGWRSEKYSERIIRRADHWRARLALAFPPDEGERGDERKAPWTQDPRGGWIREHGGKIAQVYNAAGGWSWVVFSNNWRVEHDSGWKSTLDESKVAADSELTRP